MKCDNLRALEKHLQEAASSAFAPVYLIVGKELSECQEAVNLLLRFLSPSKFTLSIFEGGQIEDEQLHNELQTASFFSKTKTLWIQQSDKLKKNALDQLENYLKHPSPTQFLILSSPSWHKNSSFYKTAEKAGLVLEFTELKPWEKERQLIEWVNQQMASARKIMAYAVCQSLVKKSHLDASLLKQELEKLLCYVGNKPEVSQQDVDAICTSQPLETIWQLGDAIFGRDTLTALQLMTAFLADEQPFMPLLRQLRAQLQTKYQIALLLAQGKSSHEISLEFPYLKGQILERQVSQTRQYGLEAFKQGLILLDETELRAKNSAVEEQILAELLIIKLTEHL